LREAHALFTERGFADVSMQEIADAVGLTKAAAYYHFRDKEGLFVEVFTAEMARLSNGVGAELERGGGFREQLLRVTRFFLDSDNLDLARLIGDFDRHVSEERRREIRATIPRPSTILEAAFAGACDTGEIRPVNLEVAVSLYLAMILGQARSVSLRLPVRHTAEELAEAIVDLTLDGIGA
jgi:AcrR family transcriptional regulator